MTLSIVKQIRKIKYHIKHKHPKFSELKEQECHKYPT